MIDSTKLEFAVNDAICRLAVCESVLGDINQCIPNDCEIKSSNGMSAEYVYYGVLGAIRSIRESLDAARKEL